MIKFWVYLENCNHQSPLIDIFYLSLPFNKISTNGMVDLSWGMGFNVMDNPRDIKVTIYILDKGYKI